MKTTIFSRQNPSSVSRTPKRIFLQLIQIILTLNYLYVIVLLFSTPQRHGFGGPNAASLPAFFLLFSLLIILHLISVLYRYIPYQLIYYGEIGLVIISAMTISLIFFSRQSFNYIQGIYPVPFFVILTLGISLIIGIYGIKRDFYQRNDKSPIISSLNNASFPLPENRYKNVRILTEGGVGTLWYAERITDGISVVVKVPIRVDEQTGISFLQEMSLWKELDHPNIVSVLSVNILPVPYMEMEYLPQSLSNMKKPVSINEAVRIMEGLLSALIYSHERGIVHCDIKPSNILFTEDGIPKLSDWGLSRSGSSRWIVSGYSPRYAAPEQSGTVSECGTATDIWQIGLVFAELLTGRAGIPRGDESVFLLPNGPVLLKIIRKCLEPNPENRYPSARLLQEDLHTETRIMNDPRICCKNVKDTMDI